MNRITLTLSAALAPLSAARAASDHFVEAQVSAPRLAGLVRTHLEADGSFCPEAVTCPDGGGSCFVDRIDYASDGRFTRGEKVDVAINAHTTLSAEALVLTQPVTVQLKTAACVDRPGCEDTTPLVADLEIAVTAGEDELCFVPRPLDGLPVPVATPEPFCLGTDLDALVQLTGDERSTITGRAVSLSTDGARVGVRFELDRDEGAYDTARVDAWDTFLSGKLGPVSGTPDWSAFAHRSLLEQAAQATIEAAFAADPALALTTAPSPRWTGLGAEGGAVDLEVGAEYDACVDLSPVTLSAQVSIDRDAGSLTTAGTVGWDVDTWDAIRCGFQDGSVIGAIAGPIVAASFDLEDLGQAFGGCEVSGDDTFRCDSKTHPQHLGLGRGVSLESSLGGVYGHAEGLELSGALTELGRAPSIAASVHAPTFGYGSGCADGTCGYTGGVSLSGNARICSVSFGADPLGMFTVTPPATLTTPAAYGVTAAPRSDRDRQSYLDAPYGLPVTVFSSSGIHTWEIPPSVLLPVVPADLSEDEAALCAAWTAKDWAQGCVAGPWRPKDARLDPEWTLGPQDRVVALRDERGLEIDVVLVDEPRLEAIWDAAGRAITGVRVTAFAYVAREPGVANVQDVALVAALPRGVTAGSLEEAITSHLRGGVAGTIAVEPAYVPVGAVAASFDLGYDQQALFDLVQ